MRRARHFGLVCPASTLLAAPLRPLLAPLAPVSALAARLLPVAVRPSSTAVAAAPQAAAAAAAALGIPLAEGEVLLHTGGAGTASMVNQSWLPTMLCTAYLGVVKGVELYTPSLEALLSPAWSLAFLAMTVGSGMLALGTTSLCVRALVLAADGQAVRVYPYGRLMGIGLGAGVTIPLRLLRENVDFAGAKRDPGALFVQVRSGGAAGVWSHAHLILDKPPAALVPRLPTPGSSLSFSPKGLSPASAAALAAAAQAAAQAARAQPLGLPPLASLAEQQALRSYVLLVWLLQGNCVVDMERLRRGEWKVDSIGADLGEGSMGNTKAGKAYQQRAMAAQWRQAQEQGTGRVYYYNVLTWERAWVNPCSTGSSSAGSSSSSTVKSG